MGKYFVKGGKAIPTKKGMLGPHSEVKAEYFGEAGSEVIASLKKRELIYEAKMSKPDADIAKADAEAKKVKADKLQAAADAAEKSEGKK